MKDNELVEVEIKHGDDSISLKRSQPQQVVDPVPVMRINPGLASLNAQSAGTAGQPAVAKSAQSAENLADIKSPIVGTFYATPSPDSEPFVEAGTVVGPQTVVCIIEAMKVLNEIKAEISGTIVEVLVTSGQAVEYGQPLFKVKPD